MVLLEYLSALTVIQCYSIHNNGVMNITNKFDGQIVFICQKMLLNITKDLCELR